MAMSPIDISTFVQAIRKAIYGEEVRESIARAIEEIQGSYANTTGANGAIKTAEHAVYIAETADDSVQNKANELVNEVIPAYEQQVADDRQAWAQQASSDNTSWNNKVSSDNDNWDEKVGVDNTALDTHYQRVVAAFTELVEADNDEWDEKYAAAIEELEYWASQGKEPVVAIPDSVINNLWPDEEPEEP